MKIETCVIGSYPVFPDTSVLMDGYFRQADTFSWEPWITTAVSDMVSAGIDIVSDGQTRDPFIQLFTRKLNGCRVRDRTEIIGKIAYDGPITVDDQLFVKSFLPKTAKLKGVLTGPFTLMRSCVDSYYSDEKQIAFDFAQALHKEAEKVQGVVDMISIDEPFFSNELPDYAIELIGTITKNISCPTVLHACGDVSRIVSDFIDMPVDVLSHEFKASPQLFDAFKEFSSSKQMCLGAVRSDDARVEPVKEIVNHVQRGVDVFGDKLIQISPDCGQRLLPRKVAFDKLTNLVQAGDIVNG